MSLVLVNVHNLNSVHGVRVKMEANIYLMILIITAAYQCVGSKGIDREIMDKRAHEGIDREIMDTRAHEGIDREIMNKRAHEEPTPTQYFAIREVRWRLVANSMNGQIEADVEVSNHDDYDVRWFMLQPGSVEGRFVEIPITRSPEYDLYVQRLWSKGRAYISGHMTIHPVPPVAEVHIKIEVTTKNYGPRLRHTFHLPVSDNYYAPRESIRPEGLEPVSFSPPQYRGTDTTAKFEYTIHSRAMPEVYVYRGETADVPTQIYDDVVWVNDDPQGEVLRVRDDEIESGQIETVVSLTIEVNGKRIYRILFTGVNERLEYYLHVLPGNEQSLFAEMHMSLESCSGIRYTGADPVEFELSSWGADCIKCVAAAPEGYLTMQITNQGMPMGSGGSHDVFWYRMSTDMAAAYFVLYDHMYTYMYQSFSHAGTYACIATASDGEYMERVFNLDFA